MEIPPPPQYQAAQVAQPVPGSPMVGYNQGQGQTFMCYPNGCTPMVVSCSPKPIIYENYRSKQSIVLGICSIIIGILCIAFNATLIGIMNRSYYGDYYYSGHYYSQYYYYYDSSIAVVGHGIWGGIFFIITGSFGIAAGRKKSKCLIVTFMVFSILSALCAAVIFSLGIVGCVTSNFADSLAMNILLTILAAMEGIVAIWGSALCCAAACCCAPSTTLVTTGTPVQFVPVNGNQQVYIVTQTATTMPVQVVPTAPYQTYSGPPPGVVNAGYSGNMYSEPLPEKQP